MKSASICGSARGFTLLELVVVVFLFSLLTGMVLPTLTKMSKSVQIAYESEEVLAQLSHLSYLAYQRHQDFELTSYPPTDGLPLLQLPKGWRVAAEPPIHFFASGACQGGIVKVQHDDGRQFQIQLRPPFCQGQRL